MADSNAPAPIEIFLIAPLYKKYAVEISYDVENFDSHLDMYCIGCKQESVFKRHGRTPNQARARIPGLISGGLGAGGYPKPDPEESQTYTVEFECSRNEKHIATFLFLVDGDAFRKIGEYPSRYDRLIPEIKKYEKELGSYYSELRKAILLNSHNVGVGAFVYLRRVLEKVVYDVAKDEFANQPEWNFKKWKDSKGGFTDVIKTLAPQLPKFLVDNSILYGILSSGIHELDEEECVSCFEIVEAAIEEILDDRMNKAEKERKRKNVSKELSKINSDSMRGK